MLTRITTRLKQLVTKTVLIADKITNSFRLLRLTRLKTYGTKKTYTVIDQLAQPATKNVKDYFGQINDIKAAKRFGTDNLKEYSHWAWRACGIACVSSILKTHSKPSVSLFSLTKEALNNNGYLFTGRSGATDIGWKHQALVDLLTKRGFKAQLSGVLSSEGILNKIARGAIFIASVQSRLFKTGRHMVLVTSFTWNGKNSRLRVTDPFLLDGNGGNKEVALSEFKRYYIGRGIIVWPNY